jgi:predicted RNase H-like HicB family nuclease
MKPTVTTTTRDHLKICFDTLLEPARFKDYGPNGLQNEELESLMQLTAVLTPAEEGGFVALNPETGTTTQGETVEEAIANLKEATALYLAEFPLPELGHPLITTFTVPGSLHA